MPIKKFKPYTPSRRFLTVADFSGLSKVRPKRSLLAPKPRSGGRNSQGKVTCRHRGGGHKRLYRIIDFKRNKDNVKAKVMTIEYDPNRSARIALLQYEDGEYSYIIAPEGLKVGDEVVSGVAADIKPGNTLLLKDIPVGTYIYNIELTPGGGGKIARSAGAMAQLLSKEEKYAQVRLPSGELRLVSLNCRATVGQVSNLEHKTITFGKAGRSRWLGRRPAVRGVAMSPRDHPHGGGEGRSPVGRKAPATPWGKIAYGVRTRGKKLTDKFIIKRRR